MTVTDIHPRPLYELRGVTKTYGQGAGQIHAVRELDLTIDEGELVAIAGPSGPFMSTVVPSAISNRYGEKCPSCTRFRHSSNRFPFGGEAVE